MMLKTRKFSKDRQVNLADDPIKNEALSAKNKEMDSKAQKLLLWSILGAVWSYLIFIVVIARFYVSFRGNHIALLIAGVIVVYLLMGVIIYDTWKSMTLFRSDPSSISRALIKSRIHKLEGQRRLVVVYLIEYALLLVTAAVFFVADIHHGLVLLFRVTTPVSLITYIPGIYFIINLTREIKKLSLAERGLKYNSIAKGFHLN